MHFRLKDYSEDLVPVLFELGADSNIKDADGTTLSLSLSLFLSLSLSRALSLIFILFVVNPPLFEGLKHYYADKMIKAVGKNIYLNQTNARKQTAALVIAGTKDSVL